MPGKIIIDCERMKYLHTGLYHYCYQLCTALIKQQPQNEKGLAFYVPPSVKGFAGNNQEYILQKWWHKLYNPTVSKHDLWHVTYQGSDYFPIKSGVKKMLTVHDLNFLHDENKSVGKKKKYLQNIQEQINRSQQLTVISAFTLQCIKDNLNIENVPVEIIYNGCNIPPKDLSFQQPAFIKKDVPYLFSIGTIVRKKNFHTLPALLVNNDYNLIIAGITQDYQYREKIISEAKKHGVENRVILPGSITENEKWWLLQNMMVFVFPSVAEGFGLPVIEAMHFGKPIILSTVTSLPEIGSDAAYYFKSFDAEDMQKTFRNSIHHFNIHPEMADAIKQRAAFFNWNESAKKYWVLYEKLTQGKRRYD